MLRLREAQRKYEEAMNSSHEPSENMKRQLQQWSEVIPSTDFHPAAKPVVAPAVVDEPAAEKSSTEKPVGAKVSDKSEHRSELKSEPLALPAALVQAAERAAPQAAPPGHAVAPAASANKQGPVRYLSGLDVGEFERSGGDLAWFRVRDQKTPALDLVANPNCHFCHKAWDGLKPMAPGGKLQLSVIMIANLPGSYAAARDPLLRPAEPGMDWTRFRRGLADRARARTEQREVEHDDARAPRQRRRHHALLDPADAVPRLRHRDGNLYSSTGVPSGRAHFLSTLI
ncbi:hypothetical protein [Methylobacterium radiotolerans]